MRPEDTALAAGTEDATFAAALNCAVEWLQDVPRGAPLQLREWLVGTHPTPRSLAERLAARGLLSWSASVRRLAESTTSTDTEAQRLVLVAAAKLAAAAQDSEAFALVDELSGIWHEVDDDFATHVASQLAVSDNGRFASLLNARVADLNTRPHAVVWGLRGEETIAHEAPTTRNRWPRRHDRFRLRQRWAYDALRWHDRAAFLKLLDRLPASLAHAVFSDRMPLSFTELQPLIADAPAAYGPQGEPLGGNAAIAVLVAAGERISRASDDGDWKPDVEAVAQVLLARADSAWLARAWLQWLLWETHGRQRSDYPTTGFLLEKLTTQLLPLGASAMMWIQDEEPLWRVDRVLVEAAILSGKDKEEEAGFLLGAAARDDLATVTGREAALKPTFESLIVGGIVAALPDPTAWFSDLWDATYNRRERLRVPRYRSVDHPGPVAVAWALAGLNCLSARPDAGASLWQTVSVAIRELHAVDLILTLPGNLPTRCFSFAGLLCSWLVEAETIQADELQLFLSDFVEPTVVFGEILATILLFGPVGPMDRLVRTKAGKLIGEALRQGVLSDLRGQSQLSTTALEQLRLYADKVDAFEEN